jgi:hypothetical protein
MRRRGSLNTMSANKDTQQQKEREKQFVSLPKSIKPDMVPNMNRRAGHDVIALCVPDSKTVPYETIQYFISKCKLI